MRDAHNKQEIRYIYIYIANQKNVKRVLIIGKQILKEMRIYIFVRILAVAKTNL